MTRQEREAFEAMRAIIRRMANASAADQPSLEQTATVIEARAALTLADAASGDETATKGR